MKTTAASFFAPTPPVTTPATKPPTHPPLAKKGLTDVFVGSVATVKALAPLTPKAVAAIEKKLPPSVGERLAMFIEGLVMVVMNVIFLPVALLAGAIALIPMSVKYGTYGAIMVGFVAASGFIGGGQKISEAFHSRA